MDTPLTPAEFAEEMTKACNGPGDEEMTHMAADDLMVKMLRALGYEEGASIFDNSPRWYA